MNNRPFPEELVPLAGLYLPPLAFHSRLCMDVDREWDERGFDLASDSHVNPAGRLVPPHFTE